MPLPIWQPEARTAATILHLLQELLRDYHPRNFVIELWDGSVWQPEAGQFRCFTWKIHQPGALRALIESPSQLELAEAYIHGEFDLEGNIEGVFSLADHLLNKRHSAVEKLRLASMLLRLPRTRPLSHPVVELHGRTHSKQRDRQVVSYHYDLSNDFYRLWLDRDMVYSCAYFSRPDDDLNTAQRQKLDYICRKLLLKPGERLLDVGCGWGGLVIHAARQYGARALGTTLSREQLRLANERIQQAGLSERCEVRLLDYRDLDEIGAYDKLASIGMVEHVGASRLEEYFSRAFRFLRPGGLFLNQGIGRWGNRPAPDQLTFLNVYVFPDSDLVPIPEVLGAAEKAGFEVRDVQNLREHYVLTLRQWLRRLEDHAEEARRLVGETNYRIWRLYLAGSVHYFKTGRQALYQTLLVRNDHGTSGLPLTRTEWSA